MEKKIFTVAIIGLGGRGADAYGWLIHNAADRYKIVSLCDIRPERIERFSKNFNVPQEDCFTTEEEFFTQKRADLLLIATPDTCHVKHALKGFALGYNLMVEKPLTENEEECKQLLDAQKKAGTKALVCHVLRYAPAFLKAAELLHSGAIGRLVAINALERVGFSHQAHSYVRGNWRNREIAAPMILAKCCHDLDLLQFYAQSKCPFRKPAKLKTQRTTAVIKIPQKPPSPIICTAPPTARDKTEKTSPFRTVFLLIPKAINDISPRLTILHILFPRKPIPGCKHPQA